MTTLTVTINGRVYGPREVRDELSMNDFLREYLGMTGTKFGCGAAQCLSCAVIVDNADGTSQTMPTCVVPAANFNSKAIRTVEGHAKNGELSVLQKALTDHDEKLYRQGYPRHPRPAHDGHAASSSHLPPGRSHRSA